VDDPVAVPLVHLSVVTDHPRVEARGQLSHPAQEPGRRVLGGESAGAEQQIVVPVRGSGLPDDVAEIRMPRRAGRDSQVGLVAHQVVDLGAEDRVPLAVERQERPGDVQVVAQLAIMADPTPRRTAAVPATPALGKAPQPQDRKQRR
jgi:hypothetical protein